MEGQCAFEYFHNKTCKSTILSGHLVMLLMNGCATIDNKENARADSASANAVSAAVTTLEAFVARFSARVTKPSSMSRRRPGAGAAALALRSAAASASCSVAFSERPAPRSWAAAASRAVAWASASAARCSGARRRGGVPGASLGPVPTRLAPAGGAAELGEPCPGLRSEEGAGPRELGRACGHLRQVERSKKFVVLHPGQVHSFFRGACPSRG